MGTRIRTHITPKMRIISFVLAFVMVFVGLPYVGGNMEVKAEETGPNIYSDTKYSNIMGTSGHDVSTTEGHRYHYTGKITKAKVTMFDYVSDYEISGNYNQCWQNEQGYVDAYQGFNSWISNSSPSFDNSATSNSITVTYKSEYFASSDSVIAHIWRGSNESNDIPMTYDTTIGKFTCTFTPGNGICYPRAILFYKGNISGSDKTSDYNINMQTNHKYEFADRTQFTYYDTESKDPHGGLIYLWADGKTSKSTNIYWKQDVSGGKWYAPHGSDHRRWYWTESWLPTKFKVQDASNNWNTGDKNFSGSIKRGWTNVFDKDGDLTNSYFPAYLEADIDYSKYTNPLYFGCFWKDNEPSGYERSNTPSYNNFWWQANMGFKPYDTNNRGNASVQGLVKSELSGGAAGKLMDVRSTDSNPVELPYFSKTFNSTYIKYYDKDNTGDNINFPFYESYIAANSGYISGIVSGSDTANEKAKFYQFCSKDSNLQFVTTDVNDHKGYFTETTTPIIHGDTQDFLPFNATDSHNTDDGKDYNNHNLGYGAKFETTFKLQRDGCVGATKLEDGSLVDVDSDTRIHTIFEFTGDDDLWVFIDGNLVLDMGGAHLESNGRIDFATKTATAYRARTLGDGVSLQDLNLDYQEKSIDFTSLLKPDSFYTDTETGNTYYNPNVSHTLTVFYMERGMLDSNLLIRFNYSPEANFSKMKITEVTDFDNINEGLKNATMKAAEDDVFMYTVTNTNTKSEDVKTNSARFPVAAQSIRTNQSVTTQLTPGTGSPGTASIDFVPGAQDVPTAVANTSYLWVDEFADNSKIVGKSNGSGQLYLMYGTCKNLYPSAEETKVGKESSAEFEKQFTRNSTMAVLQSDTLYKPNRASSPGLFGDSNSVTGNRLSSVPTATRSVSAYYETTKIVKDRDKNTIPFINESNGTFTFKNDASVDAGSSVMLTEYFTNTPRTGAITIKKELPIGEIVSPANKAFTIKVRFEDVFGVSGVHADVASEYEQIKYKVYNNSGQVGGERTMGSSTMKVGGQTKTCGTISLEVGQWAAIEDIPYNTKYIVDENEPYYAPDVTGNNTNVLAGTINGSNQAVSGNNATVKNFSHTLTIKEVTDFSGVNAGLLSYTKTAAEKDVFKYTVKNTSTVDGYDSGIPTPTYDTYERQANGATTAVKLSGQDVQYVQVDDTENVYLELPQIDSTGGWYNDSPVFAAWLYESSDPEKSDVAKEFTLVSDNLYRLDPEDYTKIIILRLNPNIKTQRGDDWLSYIWEKRTDKPSKLYCWSRIDVGTLTKGNTYKATAWNNTGDNPNYVGTVYGTSTTPQKLNTSTVIYNYNNFVYDFSDTNHYVKNVNYLWKDEFATKTDGSDNKPLAGTTDNTGSLYLMHGTVLNVTAQTTNKESSAKFYNQFARGSTMTVEQDGTLTSPNGGTPDTLKANNQRGAGTSLATYYTTTKTLEGSTTSNSLTDNVLPTGTNDFAFNNSNSNQSIHITETFTNTVRNGAISVQKKIKNNESTNETFTFQITLEDVFGVDSADVDSTGYGDITISGTNSANSKLTNNGQFTISSTETAKITGIPVGTKYTITEISAPASGFEFDSSGSSNYSGTVEAYSDESNQTPDDGNKAVIQNKRKSTSSTEIILKKTAKEQVGTTAIGTELPGAQFKLVKIETSSNNDSLRFNYDSTVTTTNEYTYAAAGTYNASGIWLETGADGRLHIKGLPNGDYYLEEQTAPSGFAATDSNNNNDPKRVYFSVGANTTTLNLTCSDEMAPAYIKLYEHINEKRDAWGNPTFIFKITQTKDANGTSLTAQRTHIVALTVDDDGKLITDNILGSDYNNWYQESTDETETVNSSPVREYMGMYHIDSEGKIRLEPGTYSITRVPVSRYEFVADTWKLQSDDTAGIYTTHKHTETNKSTGTESAVTITIPANDTGIVHYYDKVAYYDKFTHVDTAVNKFYTLDNSNQNTTVKGIRVKDITNVDTDANVTIDQSSDKLKLYFIYVDGTEREITDTAEKAKLSFTYEGSDTTFTTKFTTTESSFTITADSGFKDKIYTPKATYDGRFSTNFDLVFERTP